MSCFRCGFIRPRIRLVLCSTSDFFWRQWALEWSFISSRNHEVYERLNSGWRRCDGGVDIQQADHFPFVIFHFSVVISEPISCYLVLSRGSSANLRGQERSTNHTKEHETRGN